MHAQDKFRFIRGQIRKHTLPFIIYSLFIGKREIYDPSANFRQRGRREYFKPLHGIP